MATGEVVGFDNDENPKQIQHVEQNATMFQQLANAQVNARYIMAERHPRQIEKCRQEMIHECQRPSFCAIDPDPKKNGSSLAIYSIPRNTYEDGQKKKIFITGPTIRTAEMMKRAWGHLSVDVLPLGEDDRQRIFQVVCTDYAALTNDSEIVIVPKTVEKSFVKDGDVVISTRQNSYGKTVYLCFATEEELAMRKNALCSKARRNLILQCIPGWLVEECLNAIRGTAAKKDAEDPDKARRSLFDAFNAIGVQAEQLASYLGHTNALSPAELEELRGIYSGIREGAITWRDAVAAKEEGADGQDEAMLAEIHKLLEASGRTQAQARNLRGKYTGKVKDLLSFLREEASKKAQATAEPPKMREEPKPETKPQQEAKPTTKPLEGESRTEFERDRMGQTGEDNARRMREQAPQQTAPPPPDFSSWG